MSCRCKTINLAKISLDSMKKKAVDLQKMPPSRSTVECEPEFIPPVPRLIRTAKIQVCRQRAVDYVQPPVLCICPPCPICPSRGEQLKKLFIFALKASTFYFLFETARKKDIWGNPDGTTMIVTDMSNFVMNFFKKNPKDPDTFGGERPGILEIDRIKYNLATLWDKTVIFLFTWSIGVPLQLAHDVFETIEYIIISEDDGNGNGENGINSEVA